MRDIVEAADHIMAFTEGLDFAGFEESELVRSAVVQKLAIIGEAAARVSDELKARYPAVPWPKIVAFRNILVHAYFGIDWYEVWTAVRKQAPELRHQAAAILASF